MTKLEQLIADHQRQGIGPISYKHAEELLRQARFDGSVVVHWRGGIPRRIEVGRPVTVELKEPVAPLKILLDKTG